jgi:hypothetical protein
MIFIHIDRNDAILAKERCRAPLNAVGNANILFYPLCELSTKQFGHINI